MSQLIHLIDRFDQEIQQANARSDRMTVLKVFEEYRKAVGKLRDCADDIKAALDSWVNGSGRVSISLLLTAAAIHADLYFIDQLCALLGKKDPAVPDEMIVDILYTIPSPKAIPFLGDALSRKYNYDEYDEFSVKCLDVLAAIDTPNAWSSIENALRATSERVRNRARELIDSRRN